MHLQHVPCEAALAAGEEVALCTAQDADEMVFRDGPLTFSTVKVFDVFGQSQ